MIQKGPIKLDEKKLKEEDRRFLISDVTQRYITNEQMKLNNRSLLIAIIALFVAFAAIILPLDNITKIYRVIFILVVIIFIIIFSIDFRNSNKKIKGQIDGLNSTHSSLFMHHFKYAIKN